MLANTSEVVDAARAAGATIMHAPITFAAGYNELSKHPYGILKGVVDGSAFVKDSWGAMRSGYENGYQVITLTDCTAATSVAEHENAITYDYPMFSKPMSAAEVIAEFS